MAVDLILAVKLAQFILNDCSLCSSINTVTNVEKFGFILLFVQRWSLSPIAG
ncbi:MAG: hypothetical protein OFPII_15350 [Osedax symbiont Rs1]|nr:MAG: hypothetical protein OFPII_15350 [Osedax symbiont Rs1]